jgi:hypothetical protein
MTSRLVSKLALAAVLAVALPAIATAHEGAPERDGRPVAARAEYLSHPHARGELRRYEGRYSGRRAELERRCHDRGHVARR